MIKLYTWPTPNGRKISIALEEMGLAYEAIPVDITANEQFAPSFAAISPNNRIPAIVDGEFSLFESGAILLYLARKSGKLLPSEGSSDYWRVMEWLMWQVSGLGPMLGQAHYFLHFHPGTSAIAEERYHKEALRLYAVLEKQLAGRAFITSELTVADVAAWPWVSRFAYHKVDLNQFPSVKKWYLKLAERPAFRRGYAKPRDINPIPLPA